MTTTGDGSRSFSAALAQEVARLSAEYPKPEDIPTCVSHLDEFFRCHGSCGSAPDELILIYCPALGPQFKAMYRHGTLAECSPKFAEFKFCLSIKMLDPEDRRRAWIQRRAEWWASRRVGRSSEDVWEMRRCVIIAGQPLGKCRQTVGTANLCRISHRRRRRPQILCRKILRRDCIDNPSPLHIIYLVSCLFTHLPVPR